jgi:hypothetical protein
MTPCRAPATAKSLPRPFAAVGPPVDRGNGTSFHLGAVAAAAVAVDWRPSSCQLVGRLGRALSLLCTSCTVGA